jgi:small-conductance mechanosensitive channel
MLRQNSHWLVLGGALIVAVAAWMTWLYVGAAWAHDQAIAQATPAAAASAASASKGESQSMEREKMFTERGQLGDSFGGLNALLTAIAGALVFWAGYRLFTR